MNNERKREFAEFVGAKNIDVTSPEYEVAEKAYEAALASVSKAGFSWTKNGTSYMVHGDRASLEEVRLLVIHKAML